MDRGPGAQEAGPDAQRQAGALATDVFGARNFIVGQVSCDWPTAPSAAATTSSRSSASTRSSDCATARDWGLAQGHARDDGARSVVAMAILSAALSGKPRGDAFLRRESTEHGSILAPRSVVGAIPPWQRRTFAVLIRCSSA